MKHALRQHLYAGALLLALTSSAAAQDVRGLEVCTAEKQMELVPDACKPMSSFFSRH